MVFKHLRPKIPVTKKMKQVQISTQIPCADSHKIFNALYSEDGSTQFSFVNKYSSYTKKYISKDIVKIANEYRTFFGKVSQDIRVVEQRKLFFEGRGPFGISFRGCWTVQPLFLHLDQTIICPGPLAGRVRRKVLSIAKQIESSSSRLCSCS
jgi:hypothetical protein